VNLQTVPFPGLDADFTVLPDLVREVAARAPERPALIDAAGGVAVTYATLAARIDRVAAGLAERGFCAGRCAGGAGSEPAPRGRGVALGAMAAGGAVTGNSPLASAQETAAQLTDAGRSVLVTVPSLASESLAAATATPVRDVVVVGSSPETAAGGESPPVTPIGDLLACRAAAPDTSAAPGHVALCRIPAAPPGSQGRPCSPTPT
jgi:acyl-CoA synthetase (AMP-forming)/AMP-acid ligase II